MLNLKKTAVAVLALGSSAVFAGAMGPVCAPVAVTVPCESTAWDFGVQALYLQHSGNDFDGFFTDAVVVDGFSDFRRDPFDGNWDWGFKLEASYHFSTGNDVNVNWYHYNNSDRFNATDFSFVLPDQSTVVGDFAYQLKPQWDAVNFEFGQLVNFGEHKVIRFHGGAQYAHLERQHRWDATVVADDVVVFDGRFVDRSEEFNGFGPRVGMDMSYHFGNGFAIYANGASALLVGQNRFRERDFSISVFNRHNRDSVVPELEAKLGAMYSYATGSGEFTVDAGWMVVNYFNPLRRQINNTVNTSTSTDFNFNGPYFGAKWVGNVA